MDGEETDGEILVFISGSQDADVGQYSAFVKGGLLDPTRELGARHCAMVAGFADRA
jgi:hypothetical protein